MEDNIGLRVFAWYRISPQFLHKEDLISELHLRSVFKCLRFSHPVCEVSDKVEEEISLWYADHCKCYKRE